MEDLAEVVALLDLERVAEDRFLGHHPSARPGRVFGGQALAQALKAACVTVAEGRLPHSLHAYFIAAGSSDHPIEYVVERLRDGRSVASRRVTALQQDAPIFELTTSLGPPSGVRVAAPSASDLALPGQLPSLQDRLSGYRGELDGWWVRPRAFDLRYLDPHPREALDRPPAATPTAHRLWARATGEVPSDPVTRACLTAYLSDMALLEPVMVASRRTTVGPGSIASLDHAMWFHEIPDPGEWLLLERRLEALSQRRGLATGRIFDAAGYLVCSLAQEGQLGDGPSRVLAGGAAVPSALRRLRRPSASPTGPSSGE